MAQVIIISVKNLTPSLPGSPPLRPAETPAKRTQPHSSPAPNSARLKSDMELKISMPFYAMD